jgi:signal transduction histidine kinase
MTGGGSRRRSLRLFISISATAVTAVPVVAAALFAAVFLKNEAMRPDAAPVKWREICASHTYSGQPGRTLGRVTEPPASCPPLSRLIPVKIDWVEGLRIIPVPLDGTAGDARNTDPPVTREVRHVSASVVPELSLWPLTDALTVRHTYIEDSGRTLTLDATAVSRLSPQEKAALSEVQRTLNTQVLLLLCASALLLGLFTGVVWVATGRVLRPVEAIRREVADITAHDLSRRVSVPRGQHEITRLATTVNATLDRLEGAVRDNQRFVADASHELRGPLAALRAELEIATAHPELAHWDAVVRDALADTCRLQELTTDLLLLARLDGVPGATAVGTVDLAAVVRDELARRRSRHAITTELPDQPVPVPGSRALLARLLGNLLDNAERHAASTVSVRLRTCGGQALLDVADDGSGIPPAARERVFDRFTRLDDARARDTGGSGLGLPIARRIATTCAGSLRVADDTGGARFTAELPLARFPVP